MLDTQIGIGLVFVLNHIIAIWNRINLFEIMKYNIMLEKLIARKRSFMKNISLEI